MNQETIKEAISSIPTQETSQRLPEAWSSSKRVLGTDEDGVSSLSVYDRCPPASENMLALHTAHLKNAFPNTATDGMCVELIRLAIKQGMSEQQFADAVDHFIAYHHYPTFTPADVLNFDVRIRLYTGADVYKACGCLGQEYDLACFPRYGKINGIMYRVKATEVEQLPGDVQMKVKAQIEKMKAK